MNKIISFLRSLRRHNDREWFEAHKDSYLEVKRLADELAERLIALVAEADPAAAAMRAADVTYRIYRDVRFSHDKSPYKTHIGIFINPPRGKKSWRYGYYFHLEPGNCFICGGNMPAPGPITKAIRRSIFDNIEEFIEIVENPAFRSYFPAVGMEHLKKVPAGYPGDWPYARYLKCKDWGVVHAVSDDFLTSPDAIERLRPMVAQIKRLNDFINYTVDTIEASDGTCFMRR